MTAPLARRAVLGIAALLAPLAAGLAVAALDARSRTPPTPGAAVEFVTDALQEFDSAAAAGTAAALHLPLVEAARRIPARISDRLEGLAVYEQDEGGPVEWVGTPMDLPAAARAAAGATGFAIHRGRQLRWVTVSAPDPGGRRASATLVLDDGGGDRTLAGLLPAAVAARVDLHVERPLASTPPGAVRVVLADWNGQPAAVLRVEPGVPAGSARPIAAAGVVLAAILLLAAWRAAREFGARPLRSTVLAVAALVAARVTLLATRSSATLLTPELGGASVAGAAGSLGLLGSPADIVLTAVVALAVARWLVRWLAPDQGPPAAGSFAGLAVAAATFGAITVLVSRVVSANSRARFPGLAADTESPALAALALGLGLLVLSASLPWGGLASLRRRSGNSRRRATLLATIPIAALAGLAMRQMHDRVAIGRLQAEFGPQVLEQRATRELAVVAALDVAADELREAPALTAVSRFALHDAAHDLWLRGALFHSGLKSSLTLYDTTGQPVGHFGFDLPALDEPIDPSALSDAAPARVSVEPFLPIETVRKRLLHGALAVRSPNGELRGAVVAHVLDEPDNLPFLPASRTYLAAFSADRSDPWDAFPDYVAYDPFGVAEFHTLPRPPAWTYAFDKAAIEGRVVPVEAAGFRYHALPLVESDRLHLLLLPASTMLDFLGILVRLAAIAAVAFALLEVAAGWHAGVAPSRRSYYGKLAAALIVASVVPWLGLSIVVQRDIERRGRSLQEDAAEHIASVARRVVEDYQSSLVGDVENALPDDALLYWLRRLVGQDIHLYADGLLAASSKRELLDAGLLPERLASDVDFAINQSNRPWLVRAERYGGVQLPVAYAPVSFGAARRRLVVAVPLVVAQPEIPRATARNVELLLLSTALLAAFLAIAAAPMARTVARPIRDLAAAAERVAAGDYDARLTSTSRDEIGDLVRSFDAMVAALKSQRSDLERRRDYMEALLRHATMGVVSTDATGRIVTANPAAFELLGAAPGTAVPGTLLIDLLSRRADARPLRDALSGTVSSGEPAEVQIGLGDAARRIRTVRVALPDPEGGPPGSLLLLEDVTDLMRRNQLEAWAEMARAIAHEIKNPLTPIQLSTEHAERLLRDRGVLPDAEIESCLRNVVKQVRALRDIAAEFSAYSKVSVLEPVACDPAAFLRETIAPYRHAPPLAVRLVERYEPCPAVRIDRRVLSRAVINLVENAVQAMPDGGTLAVAAESRRASRTVDLTVADTGGGLSPEARARLFEPYFSTKSSGTGLGLAIARRAVEAHGGTIEVEDQEGGGTAFHIVLPTAEEEDRIDV